MLPALFASSISFADTYVSLNGAKASDLVSSITSDTICTANVGKTEAERTFTVDADFEGYFKLQIGGGGQSITQFTFDISEDNIFTIPSMIMASRPCDTTLLFKGTGFVHTKAFIRANPSGYNTTWNFYSEGGLFLNGGIDVEDTNIVNVANFESSAEHNIALKGKAQLNVASHKISDTKTISTSSVVLGTVTTNDSSSFSMETTGAEASSIYNLAASDSSNVNLSATNENGYFTIKTSSSLGTAITINGDVKTLSYSGTTKDVSFSASSANGASVSKMNLGDGLVQGNILATSLTWNNATKTGVIEAQTGKHQNGVALHFGEGVDFEVKSSRPLEGAYTFNNVKNVVFNAQLYVEAGKTLVAYGVEGSVKLRNDNAGMWIKDATLTFNSTNVFATTTEGSTQKDISLHFARKGGKLIINADNDFGMLELTDHSTVPTVDIQLNGFDLTFTKISMLLDNSKVVFSDFITEGGSITVSERIVTIDGEKDSALKNVYALDANGEEVFLYQWADGSIRAVAVPEPSTYAMIFGAIALGFVAYRRAKVRGRA